MLTNLLFNLFCKNQQSFIIIKMGNTLNGCTTCQTEHHHGGNNDLFEISSYYTGRLAEFEQILPQIPHYSDVNHARLVNDLRRRQQKFQDMLYPTQYLIHNPRIIWKRISQIFPKEPFRKSNFSFAFQFQQSNETTEVSNLQKALLNLNNFPDLINKIFANSQISQQGFYVLYFCLGGNVQKKIQVIVDDFIPVNLQGRYYYRSPKQGNGIWMLLVEKAWAKILKSYHALEQLTATQFFSETTGVPIPEIYTKGDFLMSGKYDFEPYESKYLKICRDSPAKLVICIWQSIQKINPFKEGLHKDFHIQAICEKFTREGIDYELMQLGRVSKDNKLVLVNGGNKGMFEVQSGQYIIHIFNRNNSRKQCNVVIHAKVPVNAHTRYQKQFQQAKMIMIKNQYKKLHNSTNLQFEYPGIQLRFCWITHRGVFCFKNKLTHSVTIEMGIKKNYLNDIIFQDSKQPVKRMLINSGQHGFFIINRQQEREYGPFYQIAIKK